MVKKSRLILGKELKLHNQKSGVHHSISNELRNEEYKAKIGWPSPGPFFDLGMNILDHPPSELTIFSSSNSDETLVNELLPNTHTLRSPYQPVPHQPISNITNTVKVIPSHLNKKEVSVEDVTNKTNKLDISTRTKSLVKKPVQHSKLNFSCLSPSDKTAASDINTSERNTSKHSCKRLNFSPAENSPKRSRMEEEILNPTSFNLSCYRLGNKTAENIRYPYDSSTPYQKNEKAFSIASSSISTADHHYNESDIDLEIVSKTPTINVNGHVVERSKVNYSQPKTNSKKVDKTVNQQSGSTRGNHTKKWKNSFNHKNIKVQEGSSRLEKSKGVSKQSVSFSTLQQDLESSNLSKNLSTAKPIQVKGSSSQLSLNKNKNTEVLNSDKKKTSVSILKKKKSNSNHNSSTFDQITTFPEERTFRRSLRNKSSDIIKSNLSTFVKQCTDGSINQKGISYDGTFSPSEDYSNNKVNGSMQCRNQLSYRSNNKSKIEKIANEQDKNNTNVSVASKSFKRRKRLCMPNRKSKKCEKSSQTNLSKIIKKSSTDKANKQENNSTLRNTVVCIGSPQTSNNNMNKKRSPKINASSVKNGDQTINNATSVNMQAHQKSLCRKEKKTPFKKVKKTNASMEKSNQTINHTNAWIKSPMKSTTNMKKTPKVMKKDASIVKAEDVFKRQKKNLSRTESDYEYDKEVIANLTSDSDNADVENYSSEKDLQSNLLSQYFIQNETQPGPEINPTIPVKVPRLNTIANLNLVRQASSVKWEKPSHNNSHDIEIFKYFTLNNFANGQIKIKAFGQKGLQKTKYDAMIFFVLLSKLQITIHETTFLVVPGDMFLVPEGNSYNIENLSNHEARLMYIQVKNPACN